MKLIVGLGNPDNKYLNTRHNVGFQVINALASDLGILLTEEKFNGRFCKNGNSIIAQPLTSMNLSGDFVKDICAFFKIDPSNVLVIYDDMDHIVGDVSIKPTGTAGGQNGLKDIILKLKTQDIARMKVGIGRKTNAINHVLKNFTAGDKLSINKIMPKIIKASRLFLDNNLNKAMSYANTKVSYTNAKAG